MVRDEEGCRQLWRYFQVGTAANRRYLDALATATPHGEGIAALDALCRPRTNHGRHLARFHPINRADLALFRAVLAGHTTSPGFATTTSPHACTPDHPTTPKKPTDDANGLPPDRQAPWSRPHRQRPTARLYRVTPYGQRVLNAAIAVHDDRYPDSYLAAT